MCPSAQRVSAAGSIIVAMNGVGRLAPSFARRNLMLYLIAAVVVIIVLL
jgi:hypothetical protein